MSLQQENSRAQGARLCETNIQELERQLQQYRSRCTKGRMGRPITTQKCRKLEDELVAQKRGGKPQAKDGPADKGARKHQLVVLQCEIRKRTQPSSQTLRWQERRGSGPQGPPLTSPMAGAPLQRWTQEPQPSGKDGSVGVRSLYRRRSRAGHQGLQHEKEKTQQCYSEYFSQTSTEFQITFVRQTPLQDCQKLRKLRDQALYNSRPYGCQDDKCEIDLVALLAPFGIPGFWDLTSYPPVKFRSCFLSLLGYIFL